MLNETNCLRIRPTSFQRFSAVWIGVSKCSDINYLYLLNDLLSGWDLIPWLLGIQYLTKMIVNLLECLKLTWVIFFFSLKAATRPTLDWRIWKLICDLTPVKSPMPASSQAAPKPSAMLPTEPNIKTELTQMRQVQSDDLISDLNSE